MMARPVGILIAFSLVAACGSSPTGPGGNGGNNGGTNGLSFTVDGAAYSGGVHTVAYDGTTFIISSANSGFQSILLSWLDDGTRNYSAGSAYEVRAFYTYVTQSWIANNNKGTGSITVTSRTSSRIKGTFSFVLDPDTGSGTKTLSAGTFDLPY